MCSVDTGHLVSCNGALWAAVKAARTLQSFPAMDKGVAREEEIHEQYCRNTELEVAQCNLFQLSTHCAALHL